MAPATPPDSNMSRMRRNIHAGCVGLLMAFGPLTGHPEASAVPFVPTDDRQVVETLRTKPLDPTWQELRELRSALSQRPDDVNLAVQLAQRYIEMSRQEADPRSLGHAQAVLVPWLAQEPPPPSVLLLRATIRQSQHEFDGALIDLRAVLRADPRNAQAWLTAAVIHQVQGRYDEARRHCASLVSLAGALTSAVCLAGSASLDGQAAQSEAMLQAIVARSGRLTGSERQWALTLLAEIAERRGYAVQAESSFQAALESGPHDPYLLAAYADFLLDRRRPRAVVELLTSERKADALFLRLVVAEQQLRMPEAERDQEALRARFAAARRRGDLVHRREEARFMLVLAGDANEAARLAVENWRSQQEPADARLLLEAALAAKAPNLARPVVDWFRRHHVEDVRLMPLVEQVERGLL